MLIIMYFHATLTKRDYTEISSETYSCFLRLKSSSEEDAIRMQPGSGETHVLYALFSCFSLSFSISVLLAKVLTPLQLTR